MTCSAVCGDSSLCLCCSELKATLGEREAELAQVKRELKELEQYKARTGLAC